MIPPSIKVHIDTVKEVLNKNELLPLTYILSNEPLMQRKLRIHLVKLHKKDGEVPEDLDWIYAQYNHIVITVPIKFKYNETHDSPSGRGNVPY